MQFNMEEYNALQNGLDLFEKCVENVKTWINRNK